MIKDVVMKKSCDKYKVRVEKYNSAMEVVNDCRKRQITNSNFHNMNDGKLGGHTKDWCAVGSYQEALDLMESGYQPVVKKLKDKLNFNLQGDGKRISFHNDIVGYAPIVPLAIQGVPNAMINSTMKKIKAKVVDVYYDIVVNCNISSEDILKAGSVLLSTIIQLEQQGYRFNLYAVQSYTDDREADVLCIKMKDASQPIDLKRLSFPLTHTAFFRVIGFDWYSKFPIGKHRWGYGRSLYYNKENKCTDIFKELFGDNSVYMSAERLRREDAEKYLEEVLKK